MTDPQTVVVPMVTDPAQLRAVLAGLAEKFPAIHDQMVTALAATMIHDGTMLFVVRELAKNANTSLADASRYLKTARDRGVLELLGRDKHDGTMRYCGYLPTDTTPEGLS